MATWAPLGAMWTARWQRLLALAWGLLVVELDYAAIRDPALPYPRLVVGCAATVVAAHLAARGPAWADGLGFRRLTPGEHRWLVRAVLLGGAVVALAIAGLGVWLHHRGASPWPVRRPASELSYVIGAVVVWPVYEETVYRLALLPGAVAALGRWGGYAVGVAAFVYLHVLYRVLDVSNVFGAVALTAVFVRTGSLRWCIALHALGNAAVVALNLTLVHAP